MVLKPSYLKNTSIMQTLFSKNLSTKILTLTFLLFYFPYLSQAQTVVTAQANQNWLGWMDIYDNTGTTHLSGSAWNVADLQTEVNPGWCQIALYPNYNTYDANNPYWSNGTIGNKVMVAHTYIEDPTLVGQNVIFRFDVLAQVLGPGYTAQAFIKVIDPANNNTIILHNTLTLIDGAQGIHSLNANVPNTPGLLTQYGFTIRGLNANITDYIAHGWVWIDDDPTAFALSKLELSATQVDQNIKLIWNTTNESQLSEYVLERSNDAQGFSPIYTANALNTAEASYSYLDDVLTGTQYYRVKSISESGEVRYSEVQKVSIRNTNTVRLYPNPSEKILNVHLLALTNENAKANIYDMQGKLVTERMLESVSTQNQEIDVATLHPGSYLLRLSYDGHTEEHVFQKR